MTTILDTAQVAADYAAVFARRGETIAIRRYTGLGASRTSADTSCLARVTGFAPHELIGSIVQGDRRVIVLVNVAVTAILPITVNDKVVIRGRECAVMGADDSTRRNAGTLIAIELQVRG